MKKLSVILVALVLLLLSACSEGNNPIYDFDGEINAYSEIKIVTEKEKYTADDTIIRYTITNTGAFDAWINSDHGCFTLHKKVDGVWKCVGTKVDQFWTDLALGLPAEESETREINLDKYFYLPLESGEYRIVVEDIASNTFEVS